MNRFMMSKARGAFIALAMFVSLGAIALVISGCNSGSTDSDNAPFSGGFVASEDNIGTLSLSVTSTRLAVSQTTGFEVSVTDQNSSPVPNISVFCDSELGIGIIEPSSGQEITNSSGRMSGRIGCAAPGSFQFGCRLPVGTNIREFVQVVCEGPIPAGFSGFENAGGGGLGNGSGGGGVAAPDDGAPGGTGTEGIRLLQIIMNDTGASDGNTFSIDVSRGNCEPDPLEDPICEPFFNTLATFRIINNSNQALQITGYSYVVPQATGDGTASYSSPTIAVSPIDGGPAVPPFGGELSITGLFTEFGSGNGGVCSSGKTFVGSGGSISTSLGFRNVSFSVFGQNENGDSFTLSGQLGLNFHNFDRCP